MCYCSTKQNSTKISVILIENTFINICKNQQYFQKCVPSILVSEKPEFHMQKSESKIMLTSLIHNLYLF